MNKLYLTKNGFKNLDKAFEDHEEKVKSLLERLGQACADDPDLPENLESKEIRAKFQGEIPAEKQRLLGIQAMAVLVENSDEFINNPNDTVWIGSEVQYCRQDRPDNKFILTIMGALESDVDNDVISYEAPIAQAMMGKKAGDTFHLENNRDLVFEIISVRKILDSNE